MERLFEHCHGLTFQSKIRSNGEPADRVWTDPIIVDPMIPAAHF